MVLSGCITFSNNQKIVSILHMDYGMKVQVLHVNSYPAQYDKNKLMILSVVYCFGRE